MRVDWLIGRELKEFVHSLASVTAENAERTELDQRVSRLKKDINERDAAVVGFFEKGDTKSLQELNNVVLSMENITRLIVEEKAIADAMNVPFPSIVFYKTMEYRSIFHKEMTQSAIRSWIVLQSLPLIVPYTVDYTKIVFDKSLGIDYYLLFFAPEKSTNAKVEDAKAVLEKIARRYRESLIIIHVPSENPRLLGYYSLDEASIPAIILTTDVGSQTLKYRYRGDFSEEPVSRFLEKGMKKNLIPSKRSEEEPEVQKGPVFVGIEMKLHGRRWLEVRSIGLCTTRRRTSWFDSTLLGMGRAPISRRPTWKWRWSSCPIRLFSLQTLTKRRMK